jgi:hypothetical protein
LVAAEPQALADGCTSHPESTEAVDFPPAFEHESASGVRVGSVQQLDELARSPAQHNGGHTHLLSQAHQLA